MKMSTGYYNLKRGEVIYYDGKNDYAKLSIFKMNPEELRLQYCWFG